MRRHGLLRLRSRRRLPGGKWEVRARVERVAEPLLLLLLAPLDPRAVLAVWLDALAALRDDRTDFLDDARKGGDGVRTAQQLDTQVAGSEP